MVVISWVSTPCSTFFVFQCFVWMYCFYLQSDWIWSRRKLTWLTAGNVLIILKSCKDCGQPDLRKAEYCWWTGKIWKENSLLDILHRHFPGETEENHENFNQNNQCPKWDLNQAPPKYKSAVLLQQHDQYYSSFHLVESLLLVGVESLQKRCQSSQAIALPPLHSIPLYFKNFCIHSSQVCWVLYSVQYLKYRGKDKIVKSLIHISSQVIWNCSSYMMFNNMSRYSSCQHNKNRSM